MIDEFDMLIAGQALSEGLTVVTDNVKHFNRIDGLKIANWLKK
jgi:predicted nucleic acid-binding protein